MSDDLEILLDLRLVAPSSPPAAWFGYARSCSRDCDAGLWRCGYELARTAETGERASDEEALLAPAGPCRDCGALTDRWRLVRRAG